MNIGDLLDEVVAHLPAEEMDEAEPDIIKIAVVGQMCIRDSNSSIFSILLIPSGAVSYTHLDVYKRQLMIFFCNISNNSFAKPNCIFI